MRNGRVRVFLLRRRAVAAVGALVLAGAIFWAVSYPAGAPASAAQRQLPIYSVEREKKMCSRSTLPGVARTPRPSSTSWPGTR